ncbi:MAG TPA: magnesium transporter [Polyangiaceae bacterium]
MTLAFESLVTAYVGRHPAAAARTLARRPPGETAGLLEHIAVPPATGLLTHLGAEDAARVVCRLSEERARALLTATDFVEVATWLAHLERDERERVLGLLPATTARNVREALDFPPGTAGQLMDPRVITFDRATTVDEALSRVRQLEGARVDDLILTDEHGALAGVAPIRKLLTAPLTEKLASVADRAHPAVHVMAGRDEVVELLRAHPSSVLPVVDLEGRVLGVLRQEELVEAARQAATDDFQQMVGAGKEERALSPALFAVKNRLPWLLINLVTGFLAATVVATFDRVIAQLTALAVLMPVVAGQAGNTGAQALAVTVRGLSLREIRVGHVLRVLSKEIRAAALNGIAIAFVTAASTFVWSGNAPLALVIGVSMVVSMVVAATAGAAVPIVLTALKRDPASASSIFLTMITDITGFSSFLGLASALAGPIANP